MMVTAGLATALNNSLKTLIRVGLELFCSSGMLTPYPSRLLRRCIPRNDNEMALRGSGKPLFLFLGLMILITPLSLLF